MLLTKEEIKEQTRQLWKESFHDSEDFLDIYFEEKYSDDINLTMRPDGYVAGAVQVLPYRTTLFDSVWHTGYISGLAISEKYRNKGMASQLLSQAHRHLYNKGALLSFLIPSNEELRHFYESEKHGAYWTAIYRKEQQLTVEGVLDSSIKVFQPDEWGQDLYVFYHKYTMLMPFMLHPSENDFFAALASCDIDGGWVLVARTKGRVVGLCLAVPGEEDSCRVLSMIVTEEKVKDSLIHNLILRSERNKIYANFPSGGSDAEAKPYAMARVINVEKFLKKIAMLFPDMQMRIGVGQDLDIPENNGFYEIEDGKVKITDVTPDSIVTPGGLAAMFLSMYPIRMEMMLDE